MLRSDANAARVPRGVRNEVVLGVVDRATLERIRDGDAGHTPDSRLADVLKEHALVVALPGETCRRVATRLAVHGLERLPVVNDTNTLRLVGIVSRSDLIKPSIAHFEEEYKKERFRRLGFSSGRRHFPPARKATRTDA